MTSGIRLAIFCAVIAWGGISLYRDIKNPERRRWLLKVLY
jgi:hypothetical protein